MSEPVVILDDSIDLIFALAQMQRPQVVTNEEINQALHEIKNRLNDFAAFEVIQNNEEEGFKENLEYHPADKKKILVVDDIGVVTYQLKLLFQKMGFIADTAKDIYGAIKLLRQNVYDYIVMDLFVSTEHEGFLLLDEAKKTIVTNNLNTKIVVITASAKGEHKVKCLNRGANMFLQKDIGWQEKLVNFITEEE